VLISVQNYKTTTNPDFTHLRSSTKYSLICSVFQKMP